MSDGAKAPEQEVKKEEVVEAPRLVQEDPAPSTSEVTPAPVESTAAEQNALPPPPPTEDPETGDKKAEPEPVKPVTEGYLHFKAPGLLHIIPSKKFFYIQDEPIALENLQGCLKTKSPSVHSNVAFATQTGKGLLFYTKNQEQKAHPTGIINLADVIEVQVPGTTKFALKTQHEVFHFDSAANTRDGWVATIRAKLDEAKEVAEIVKASEDYQTTYSKLAKPLKAPETKESKDKGEESKDKEKEKEKDKEHEGEGDKKTKGDEKEKDKTKSDSSSSSSSSSSSDDEARPSKKGKEVKRSVSKKRASFFGIIGFDRKKEEKKDDDKKEEPKPEEVKPENSETPAASGEETKSTEETKPEETPKTVETPTSEPASPTPRAKNRHSVFGFFDKKREIEKKRDEDVKPDESKTEPPPTTDVPVEDKPADAPAPAESGVKTPASPPKESFLDKFFKKDKPSSIVVAPTAETKNGEDPESKPEDSANPEAEAPSPKRRQSFFASLGKKEKKPDIKSDTEDESKGTSSPPRQKKLGIFRSHSKSAKDAPKEESKEGAPPVPEIPPAVATETHLDPAPEPAAPAPAAEPNPAIGDVVPDAVTVGQTNTAGATA